MHTQVHDALQLSVVDATANMHLKTVAAGKKVVCLCVCVSVCLCVWCVLDVMLTASDKV